MRLSAAALSVVARTAGEEGVQVKVRLSLKDGDCHGSLGTLPVASCIGGGPPELWSSTVIWQYR